jgi:hypothetical protein
MSKNFRSSFIDLLCCRYSKRHPFGHNDSLRNRRVTENYMKNLNSKYRKNDYVIQSSVLSRFSQLNPATAISTTDGATTFSSPSRLATELLSKYEQKDLIDDENKLSIDNHSSCHITVGTQTNTLNKPHRRRKNGDRSPVIAYCSVTSQSTLKPTEMLCK